MKKAILPFLAFLCMLFAVPESGRGESADIRPHRKATVILYMCGADLESVNNMGTGVTLKSINGNKQINSEEINVVVLQGGANRWGSGIDPSVLNIGECGNRRRTTQTASWPLASMGDPSTLTMFLDYCRETYPADRYYLIMWDHGGGPNRGVCFDELFDHDSLSVNELAKGLDDSAFRDDKLEMIIFHTCLTGSIEYAASLAPYARYMVATEDSHYGLVHDWIAMLDTEDDPYVIAKKLVDDSYAFNKAAIEENNESEINSVVMIDLAKIQPAVTAMDQFFGEIIPSVDTPRFIQFSEHQRNSSHFGVTESGGDSGRDLTDLGNLVYNLREYAPERADTLLQALSESVPYKQSALDSLYGLTVYHPYANIPYLKSFMEVHNSISLSDNYSSYIQKYASILTGTPLTDWRGMKADASVSKVNRDILVMNLTAEQQAHMTGASLIVLERQEDGSFRFVGLNSSVAVNENQLTGEYAGTALYAVRDGQALSPAITYGMAGNGNWLIPAELTLNGTAYSALIRCIPDPDSETLRPGSVLLKEDEGGLYNVTYGLVFDDFEQVSLPVVSRAETRDENGVLRFFADWDAVSEEAWTAPIDGSWQFMLLHDTIPPEALCAAFEVQDIQAGTYMSEIADLKAKKTGSGYTSLSYDDMDLAMITRYSMSVVQGNLLISADVTNLREEETIFSLKSLKLNGEPHDASAEVVGSGPNWGLLKDETQVLMLSLPLSGLPVSGELTEVTFTLAAEDAASGASRGELHVTVSASLPLAE